MTIALADLPRRTPDELRAFVRAQHGTWSVIRTP